METQELLRKVRQIEIKTRGLSHQIFSGEYHSAFKGRGMSFSEVREYQYGDDIRSIDWNVTARFNQPYIKVFEEERELTVILMVDVSASSSFGAFEQGKKALITELSAVLSFSAINNNDKVGMIFFSDKVEKFIPPKKGKSHILMIIRELLNFTPVNSKTDLGEALKFLNNFMKKRAIVFILSDFYDDAYKSPLSIAAKKHDLVGLKINDPRDAELPNIGMLQVYDSENNSVRVMDSASKKIRKRYSEQYKRYDSYFESSFLLSGADKLRISTDQNYVTRLMTFFKRRELRR